MNNNYANIFGSNRGFTLVEALTAVMLTGIIVTILASAAGIMIRMERQHPPDSDIAGDVTRLNRLLTSIVPLQPGTPAQFHLTGGIGLTLDAHCMTSMGTGGAGSPGFGNLKINWSPGSPLMADLNFNPDNQSQRQLIPLFPGLTAARCQCFSKEMGWVSHWPAEEPGQIPEAVRFQIDINTGGHAETVELVAILPQGEHR